MIQSYFEKLFSLEEEIWELLLLDQTTKKPILWGSEEYQYLGGAYFPQAPITKRLLLSEQHPVIRPRIFRSNNENEQRVKKMAEVFTPAWVCNLQNNIIDEGWFGRPHVFNFGTEGGWETVSERIAFPADRRWQTYVDERRIELCCGEAPYLVSRYDMVTGTPIPISERIGLLDRKLRVVGEQVSDEKEWFHWVCRAFESIYAFEYQGDSLVIARTNLLYTFLEYLEYQWQRTPTLAELRKITRIISWNLWQMDGITMTVPFSEREAVEEQLSFLESTPMEAIPCRVYDWRAGKSWEFRSLLRKGGKR